MKLISSIEDVSLRTNEVSLSITSPFLKCSNTTSNSFNGTSISLSNTSSSPSSKLDNFVCLKINQAQTSQVGLSKVESYETKKILYSYFRNILKE